MDYEYVAQRLITSITGGGPLRKHHSQGEVRASGVLRGDAADFWSLSLARSAELELEDGESAPITVTNWRDGRTVAQFSMRKPPQA